MNPSLLRVQIKEAFPKCRQCDSRIDEWPDADCSEQAEPVIYILDKALWVGICPSGHVNEFYLKDVKAGDITAHDVTERTLGRFVSQENCLHAKRASFPIPAGVSMIAEGGKLVTGPAEATVCGYCMLRFNIKATQGGHA